MVSASVMTLGSASPISRSRLTGMVEGGQDQLGWINGCWLLLDGGCSTD